jgi:hypothetical protein
LHLLNVYHHHDIDISGALEKTPVEDEKLTETEDKSNEVEDNGKTIRPGWSPPTIASELPSLSTSIAPVVEDYSDFVVDEDEEKLEEKLAELKVRATSPIL